MRKKRRPQGECSHATPTDPRLMQAHHLQPDICRYISRLDLLGGTNIPTYFAIYRDKIDTAPNAEDLHGVTPHLLKKLKVARGATFSRATLTLIAERAATIDIIVPLIGQVLALVTRHYGIPRRRLSSLSPALTWHRNYSIRGMHRASRDHEGARRSHAAVGMVPHVTATGQLFSDH